ncbi:MAG TPA: hypothetical protein VGP72_31615 [Planctomycetota bacterium]
MAATHHPVLPQLSDRSDHQPEAPAQKSCEHNGASANIRQTANDGPRRVLHSRC